MIFSIDDVLREEELEAILSGCDRGEFVDGKLTAGWHAKLVKENTQLAKNSDLAKDLQSILKKALKRHPLFKSAVLPRQIHSIIFSRYQTGMSYGTHVDNALMGQEKFFRSDISFTLFLSDPETYEGGELVTELSEGDRVYKLPKNSVILYPSSTLHRVEPVKSGNRLVAVGWVQSLVRAPHKREVLFDLDTARRALFAQFGKTTEFDLISKSYANLLRQWAE